MHLNHKDDKEAAVKTREVRTIDGARQMVRERELGYVKVGLFDIGGVMRDKFLSALDEGFGICDAVLGWDSNDQLYDNVSVTGWHTGYGDAKVRIPPQSRRELPLEEGSLAWTGVKHSGQGCTFSSVGFEQVTRPKSFHFKTKI